MTYQNIRNNQSYIHLKNDTIFAIKKDQKKYKKGNQQAMSDWKIVRLLRRFNAGLRCERWIWSIVYGVTAWSQCYEWSMRFPRDHMLIKPRTQYLVVYNVDDSAERRQVSNYVTCMEKSLG